MPRRSRPGKKIENDISFLRPLFDHVLNEAQGLREAENSGIEKGIHVSSSIFGKNSFADHSGKSGEIRFEFTQE